MVLYHSFTAVVVEKAHISGLWILIPTWDRCELNIEKITTYQMCFEWSCMSVSKCLVQNVDSECLENSWFGWVKFPSLLRCQRIVRFWWLVLGWVHLASSYPVRQVWVLHDQPLLLHLLKGVIGIHVQWGVVLVHSDLGLANSREVGWDGKVACKRLNINRWLWILIPT